jgi:hypothetical protein
MGINVMNLEIKLFKFFVRFSALNEYGHKEHIPSEDYIFHVTKLFDKSIEKKMV